MSCGGPSSRGELKALGADLVIVDGDDLAARVGKAAGDARIMLGVEAIGGAATGRLADCVATDGTLVHYGSMSGEDPNVGRNNFIYRGVQAHRLHAGPLPRQAQRRSRSARSTPTSPAR